jgi:hypothetical protein
MQGIQLNGQDRSPTENGLPVLRLQLWYPLFQLRQLLHLSSRAGA